MSDIGTLTFKVAGDAKNAAENLDALRNSLVQLKSATASNKKLTEVANGIRTIAEATASLSGNGAAALSTTATALQGLKSVSIPKNLVTGLKGLKEAFDGFTVGDMSGLNSIANAAAALNGQDYTGLAQFANSMSKAVPIFEQLNGLDVGRAASNISQMAKVLPALSNLNSTSDFNLTLNHLKKVPELVNAVSATDTSGFRSKVRDLTAALGSSGLGSIEKASGFTSTINSLKKLPEVFKQLETVNMSSFAAKIQEVSAALAPLSEQLAAIGTGLAALPGVMNKAAAGTNALSSAAGKMESRFKKFLNIYVLARIVRMFGQIINKATSYIENVNLFTVAMGDYADSAMKYAEKVSDKMGIDTSEWIRAQGVFRTLASGFGVASDRATIMSQNLTQLAYDISSFYNLDINNAIEKLEAAFSGDIKPVRKLGYDLSKVTLQAAAADLGITKLWTDMTQAEKSQLRYYVLMTQVTQVQGDMARTLNAPANQLRILKQQFQMCARAIGNVFIPMLNAMLPHIIAAMRFIRALADYVASLLGFEIPEIDYSGMTTGVDDVDDAVGDLDDDLNNATGSAKKLKNMLASFDELNIIQSETGGGAGGGGGGIGGLSDGWVDFALPTYDFLNGVLQSRADEIFEKMRGTLEKMKPVIKWIVEHFSTIWKVVKGIALTILGIKLIKKLTAAWTALKKFLPTLQALDKQLLGLGISIAGFSIEFSGAKAIGYGNAGAWDYIKTALGAALGVAGSLLVFGTGPAGWIIGIGAAITVFITGFVIGEKERLRDSVDEQFREAFVGAIDPQKYASIITNRLNSITSYLQSGIEINANVQADLGELNKILNSLDDFRLIISTVGELTDTQVTQMNSAFARLYEVGGQYINDSYDLLENGLINALRILPDEAKTAVEGYLRELGVLEGGEKDRIAEYTRLYEEAMNKAASASPGSAAQQAALDEAAKYATAVALASGQVLDASATMAGAITAANANIENVNFENYEQVQGYLSAVKDAYDEAAGVINEYWAAEIENATARKSAAKSVGDAEGVAYYEGVIEAFKLAQQRQLAQLGDEMDKYTLPVAQKMAEAAAGAFDKAAEDYENSGFVSKLFGNAATFAGEEARDWYNNYLSPLADQMEALGTPRATEVANAIRDGWESGLEGGIYQVGIGERIESGLFDEETWTGYLQTIIDAVAGMGGDIEQVFGELGALAGDGLNSAIEGALNDIGLDFVDLAGGAGKDAGTVYGDEMASAVASALSSMGFDFADLANRAGVETGDSFGDGINSAIETALNALGLDFVDLAGDAGRDIGNSFGSNMTSAIGEQTGELGERLKRWWRRISGSTQPTVHGNTFGFGEITVQPFATGGFPQRGSLFLAGEGGGAEIVGSMGNQTAVANGDQIVAGIASGVARANAEETRLLREQNSLLRQIAATGGQVVFPVGPEAGRAIQFSLNAYATQRGY